MRNKEEWKLIKNIKINNNEPAHNSRRREHTSNTHTTEYKHKTRNYERQSIHNDGLKK
jgi:hypothetical protein